MPDNVLELKDEKIEKKEFSSNFESKKNSPIVKKIVKKNKGIVVSVFKNSILVVDSNNKGYRLYNNIKGKKVGDTIEF